MMQKTSWMLVPNKHHLIHFTNTMNVAIALTKNWNKVFDDHPSLAEKSWFHWDAKKRLVWINWRTSASNCSDKEEKILSKRTFEFNPEFIDFLPLPCKRHNQNNRSSWNFEDNSKYQRENPKMEGLCQKSRKDKPRLKTFQRNAINCYFFAFLSETFSARKNFRNLKKCLPGKVPTAGYNCFSMDDLKILSFSKIQHFSIINSLWRKNKCANSHEVFSRNSRKNSSAKS